MSYRHAIPGFAPLLAKYATRLAELAALALPESQRTDAYRSWEYLRYRRAPQDLTTEEWWFGIKYHRLQAREPIPLRCAGNVMFSYAVNRLIMQQLCAVDELAYGDPNSADIFWKESRHAISPIMEESIMSSVLEGANVTRADARQMLRENRRPNGMDERMILNNYRTMMQVSRWKEKPITPEAILELHRIMTDGTLQKPEKVGCLRAQEDDVRVENVITGEIIHLPPPADTLPQRLEELCAYANEPGNCLHPILKAIIVHFWLAWLHPFVDGNGRTARALFYWVALQHGYGLFEYVSISNEIQSKKHGKSYYTAFLDTEEDEGDLNYFICDQLFTILRAIQSLHRYIGRKRDEQHALLQRAPIGLEYNPRQRQLLTSLLQDADAGITVDAHMHQHKVSRQTARSDLMELVKDKLLTQQKIGKAFVFFAVDELEDKLTNPVPRAFRL